jgi:hypothetical protein
MKLFEASKKVKALVFERDKRTCDCCGKVFSEKFLNAICTALPGKEINKASDFITVCNPCCRYILEMLECNYVFKEHFPRARLFTSEFKLSSIKLFIENVGAGLDEVNEAMEKACTKFSRAKEPDNAKSAIRYFCGICWHKIKKTRAEAEKVRNEVTQTKPEVLTVDCKKLCLN